jgi:hypothetical protein
MPNSVACRLGLFWCQNGHAVVVILPVVVDPIHFRNADYKSTCIRDEESNKSFLVGIFILVVHLENNNVQNVGQEMSAVGHYHVCDAQSVHINTATVLSYGS